jgi:hypothetical protein
MIETGKVTETDAGVTSAVQSDASPQVAHALTPLVLQADEAASDAPQYHVRQLLCYHDRAFITHAYAALCKRPPTETELARTLEDLRGGRRSKIEIIADLSAQPGVHARVVGLPSPVARRLGRLPLVGRVLRVLRALVRLPVLVEHQQQFEAYTTGQQQRIADHINAIVAPTIADACEGVLMLSDALADLSQRHAQLEAALAVQQQRHVELQQRHAEQLEAILVVQQQRHAELRQEQQEFLIQEQHVIVETQKIALADAQAQLRALADAQEQKRAELAAELRRLRTLVEALRTGAAVHADDAAEVERT